MDLHSHSLKHSLRKVLKISIKRNGFWVIGVPNIDARTAKSAIRAVCESGPYSRLNEPKFDKIKL